MAEELGRGLADVSFFGPTMAGELRRLAGAAPGPAVETVALTADLSSLACAGAGRMPPVVAVDVQGSSTALLLADGPEGRLLAEAVLPPVHAGVDLTRPATALRSAVAGGHRRVGRPARSRAMT